ncbi:GNAT family N-acetyltransferase [Sphingomonas xinjiangensis]|uniref:Ribosomal-protein-alanine N-acetyltransferase n=1 Tax=Sphingomonas xinjiangensis TaxID=643568 RepID=A0A840YQ42_9SPHN|nr:GNAT family N-acetyltransferase [Sphingomonas xinjiangensis]MBB5710053.1 ribosomal-protein-alanine N-acetyltransferase [Sphingomonas xinjiangensis]
MSVNLVELREGGAQDLTSVNQIMQDAFDPQYGEAWTKPQCMGMLSLPGVWLTIANSDGVDAGFALAREVAGDAELLLLATRKATQRRGIGATLVRAVIAEAHARGAEQLHLEVRAGNDAVRLYCSAGFAKVGERKDYYKGRTGELFNAQTFARVLR